MKSTLFGYTTKAMMVAAALLGTLLAAGPAKAQSEFQGKFTLQQQTRWGKAILPAGQYRLTIDHSAGIAMVTVRDAKSERIVAFVESQVTQQSRAGESALLLKPREIGMAVQALRVAELGKTFVYAPTGEEGVPEQATNIKEVPILQAMR